MKQEQLIGNL